MGWKEKFLNLKKDKEKDIKDKNVRDARMDTDLINFEKAKLNIVKEFGSASLEQIKAAIEQKEKQFGEKQRLFLQPINVYGPKAEEVGPRYEALQGLNEERLELGTIYNEIEVLKWLSGEQAVHTELTFKNGSPE